MLEQDLNAQQDQYGAAGKLSLGLILCAEYITDLYTDGGDDECSDSDK